MSDETNWGAGTGGTAETLGRFIRYKGFNTNLCIADVERSAFFEAFRTGDKEVRCVEPSFIPSVIDRMVRFRTPLRSPRRE